MINKRDFLKLLVLSSVSSVLSPRVSLGQDKPKFREAMFYQKQGNNTVRCELCPRGCGLSDGDTGFCRARKNIGGTLYSLGYAAPCAIHVDPIEKKPFFNYYPKTLSFSIACAGCNLRCKFCQNWQISQASPIDTKNYEVSPENISGMSRKYECKSVAYTYTEPTTFYEYMLDTSKINRKKGILNVYHSNGFINQPPLELLCKYLDAANIDLKGFSDDFYRKVCEAELAPVLDTLKTLKKSGVWVEITNLVIPGYNDDVNLISNMCRWIKANLGNDTPLHLSRFFPLYKMTGVSATPVETLERARDAAIKSGLDYVYIGNVPGHNGEHTYCPKCRKLLVRRSGFSVLENNINNSRCRFCNEKIRGNWTT